MEIRVTHGSCPVLCPSPTIRYRDKYTVLHKRIIHLHSYDLTASLYRPCSAASHGLGGGGQPAEGRLHHALQVPVHRAPAAAESAYPRLSGARGGREWTHGHGGRRGRRRRRRGPLPATAALRLDRGPADRHADAGAGGESGRGGQWRCSAVETEAGVGDTAAENVGNVGVVELMAAKVYRS